MQIREDIEYHAQYSFHRRWRFFRINLMLPIEGVADAARLDAGNAKTIPDDETNSVAGPWLIDRDAR
jgi:hypothetical protein